MSTQSQRSISRPSSTKSPSSLPLPLRQPTFSRLNHTSLQWTGFTSVQGFALFLSTVCLFALFSASQTTWMRPQAPGAKFWFERTPWLGAGLKWHAWCMIPVGIFLPIQFLPRVRTKWPTLHRWLGRVLILGVSLGNIGGMMATRRSFGGTVTAQVSFGTLVAMSSFSMWKAWDAIRHVRVDSHRVWMLRAWSYICSVLTLRVLMAIFSFSIIHFSPGRYKTVSTCAEILYIYETLSCNFSRSLPRVLERYPACADLNGGDGRVVFVIVNASLDVKKPEEIFSILSLVYGVCAFLALIIHAIGLEVYLELSRQKDRKVKSGVEEKKK